jgi:hypothetical protein
MPVAKTAFLAKKSSLHIANHPIMGIKLSILNLFIPFSHEPYMAYFAG